MFAGDAAPISHTEEEPEQTVIQYGHVCREIELTIIIKKPNILGQGISVPSSIIIDNEVLAVKFRHKPTIHHRQQPVLDKEIDKPIARAAVAMVRLNERMWKNNQLTLNTTIKAFQTCILSVLLYDSEF